MLAWDAVAKRSVRAAIVIPGLFAFGDKVMGNASVATFASIGGFSMLLLADFGGPLRPRLTAYASLGVVGAMFITIGTLCSRTTWLAVTVAAILAALVLFGGILSGYVARGSTAALLILVLPLTLPAGPGAIPSRLEGWTLASVVGTLAVFLIWRDPPQSGLRLKASRALDAIADHLGTTLDGAAAEESSATVQTEVGKLRNAYLATPFRPTGATAAEQAVVALVAEIDWLRELTAKHDDLPDDGYRRAASEDRELLTTSIAALHDAAKALRDADAGSTGMVACRTSENDGPALVIDLESLAGRRAAAAMAIAERVDRLGCSGHRGGRRCAGVFVPRSVGRDRNRSCGVVRPCCVGQCRRRRGARRTVALVRGC